MSTGFAQQGGTFRLNGRVIYEASEKQLAYHNSPAPYPLYGGSKGCGKSIALRFDHYLPSLLVPNMTSLILRRKLKDLERSHIRFVPREAQMLGAQWKPSDVGAGVLYFPHETAPNRSLIEFGHCQHETDVDQYLSAQYDRISYDELVTFLENQYLLISSCCRTTIPGMIPRVGGATNPGGKAARWVKRRWIDKDLTEEDDEDYRPEDYAYIPALPTDNKHLNWAQYMRQLNRLPPELRRAYRDGDWDIFIGQFFPEFRKTARPNKDGVLQPPHLVEFPQAPKEWPRYCGLDWGYQSEGVCVWVVHHPDGFLDVEDEYVFNGERRDKLIAREVAQEIVRRNAARGIRVRRTYADPSMGEQRGHESAETYLTTFKKHGVPCEPADNDRVNGWARIRAWLRNRPDGQPFLRIHPRCTYLSRTFGEVVMDEQEHEDLDCWVAGTPVSTPNGTRPIEQIVAGDMVATPIGPRRVLKSYLSGPGGTTWVTLSDGRRLEGTDHHKVYAKTRGLIPLVLLGVGDILEDQNTWSNALRIAVSCTRAMAAARTTIQTARSWRAARKVCIGRFGWMPVAKFLRITRSIIATAITTTTTSRTWPVFPKPITPDCTSAHGWPARWASNWRHGEPAPRGRRSSEATPRRCAVEVRDVHVRADIVAVLSARDTLARYFARAHASVWGRHLSAPVKYVARRFGLATARPAPVHIVAVGHCAARKPVYNLTVADAHLFYANGILSSNTDGPDHALDALRYVIAARPQAPGAAVSVDYPAGSAGDLKRQLMAAGRGARVLGTANVRRRR